MKSLFLIKEGSFENLETIKIKSVISEVIFYKGDKNKFEYYSNSDDFNGSININTENNTFSFTEYFRTPFTDNFNLKNVLKIYLSYIPENLFITEKAGKIDLENFESSKIIEIKLLAGSVKGKFLKTKDFSLDMKAGDINFENIESSFFSTNIKAGSFKVSEINSKKIFLDGSAGEFRIKKITSKTFETNQKAAEISLDELNTEDFDLNCAAGNILIKSCDFKYGSAKVSLGNLKIGISKNNVKISSRVSLGNIKLFGENQQNHSELIFGEGNKKLKLDVSLGNIEVY